MEKMQKDICGAIYPPYRPFRYCIISINVSIKLSHLCLLSTHDLVFANLLAQIIWLRASFQIIQSRVFLDNASGFRPKAFNDYCTTIWINIK